MSVTSQLKQKSSPIRNFVTSRVSDVGKHLVDLKLPGTAIMPNISSSRAQGSIVTPAYNFAIIGRAIDFRLRYYFTSNPGFSVCERGVFWHRSLIILYQYLGEELNDMERKVKPHKRKTPLSYEQESQVNRLCVLLAYFEEIGRGGRDALTYSRLLNPTPIETIADALLLVREAEVQDLCNLSWAFLKSHGDLLKSRLTTVAHPIFEGSCQIGGADGDIIIDRCLIDFKATQNPLAAMREGLLQLVCYALLDYSDEYGVREVGIYLARQAGLFRWPLKTLLGITTDEELKVIRAEFEQVVLATTGFDRNGAAIDERRSRRSQ